MAVANQRVPWINPTSESGVVPWVILGLTIAYIVTGRLGLLLAEHQENATLIWVPTGLSLAALVLWGKKVWPAVFLGAGCVNIMIGTDALASFGIAVGNTLEAVLGAWLLTSVGRLDPAFGKLRDVWVFLAYGAITSTFVCASIGVSSLYLMGAVAPGSFFTVWLDWWLGDAGGALVFAPLLMIAVRGLPSWATLLRRYETPLVMMLTVAASAIPFLGFLPGEWQLLGVFMPFPFIAWAGLRLGPRGAVMTTSLACLIAISGAAQSVGPFAGDVGMYLTWSYMTIMALSALILATTVAECENAERERGRLELQLHHAQRLDSVGVLAGGIAHDFNNLLTPIRANAEMIRTFDVPPDERQRMIEGIEAAATKASELCRLMLSYAGRDKPRMQPVDIVAVAKQARSLLDSSKSSRIQLRYEIEGEIPKIEGDPTQLQQILVNLIMNASDAIADRGTITVKFAVGQFDREYLETTFLHSNANPGTFVSVDVTDDGEGMTPQIMSRVFDPFFSTKESGHGLGIAAVQRIVGLHGGAVKVESEPGLGSTFRLLLRPCAYEETTLQDVDANPHSTGGGVLVADDDAQVRAAAERILVRAGYSVTVAEDGASALAYFEQHIDEIDLALLDVLMPGLDGTETLIAMRNIDPDLPVVLMSGFDRAKLDKLEDESIEFVQKPFGWHSLTSAVGRAISASPRHRAATAHSA